MPGITIAVPGSIAQLGGASMRPRLNAGDHQGQTRRPRRGIAHASMRPRLNAGDHKKGIQGHGIRYTASMRPRLNAGDHGDRPLKVLGIARLQ